MVAIVYSERFLEHFQGFAHPESKERLLAILNELKKKNEENWNKEDKISLEKIKMVSPIEIKEEELLLVHEKSYIEKLKEYSRKKISFLDNYFNEKTFEIAKLAASAAKTAALNCEKEFSFALVRPPGHHAGKNFFAGFCYINNIAFATKSLQKKYNERKKIMIIDFDFHFGNGTWDIFYEDKSVFLLSFHCDPNFAYPGTGFEDESIDHMINVTFLPNVSDEEYLNKFEKNVKKYFEEFNPDFIAISAGFDTYYKDPIAGLNIKNLKTYEKIGEIIKNLERPSFGVLEGGYYIPILGNAFKKFLTPFLL